MIKVYIDGASEGNPGRAGIGYLIFDDEVLIKKESIYLGIQTNNFAEYMSLIFALIDIFGMKDKKVEVFSDSLVLCEQINGKFKIKSKNLYPLYILAKKIISNFTNFSLLYIDREKNKDADELAKNAIGFC
ncbi:MAG: ribonuclease HI family protein [Candidatus Omnitrophica bacterium]|nr:ribonuclease HI family protein [Candidatus Omnitrophota bacterium]